MKSVNGAAFRRMLVCAANSLEANKHTVDDMNVFPVPDGDTGTNMSHTFTSAIKEVINTESSKVGEIADALSRGALRGARGNSGVILSQLLRGMAKGLKGDEEMDTIALAMAVSNGVEMAYKAVMKPKEGTILTVAKAISDAALSLSVEETEVEDLLAHSLAAGEAMLAKTPDMLPVLKEAGVVDAGGQGLVFIYRGLLEGLTGDSAEVAPVLALSQSEGAEAAEEHRGPAQANFATESILYTYCTEFIAEKVQDAESHEDELRTFLSGIGDSLVVVADGDLLKDHVHTNDPGLVIRKATSLGELTSVKIENMRLQHQNILEIAGQDAVKKAPAGPHKDVGFIAVSTGDGLKQVFEDLGVDVVISGGQTMNPSTEDILEAAESINADVIYVFPNNKNIILAAQQAALMTEDRKLIVVPTKSVPQGISALINFMPTEDPEDAAAEMTEAIGAVKDGQLTYAVRDTVMGKFKIKENDILGLMNGDIKEVGKDLKKTACRLLDDLLKDGGDYLSIYYGEAVAEDAAEELAAYVEKKHPGVSVETVYGGQALYYYLISVE